MDNKTRAERAEVSLTIEYLNTIQNEGLETAISDLMVDLLHLNNQNPDKTLSVKQLLFRVENHFAEECSEELIS